MSAVDASQEFTLVKLEEGKMVPLYDGDGQLLRFATGSLADAEARKLSSKLGTKVQPRRVYDKRWRDRETLRMENGTYRPLPWADAPWWKGLRPIWKDHFPHVSVQKQALIAYSENDEKGAADIQTPIKPGRYLERFFSDKLDEYSRRDLCCVLSCKFESQELMFTDDPEEVEEIFVTGPNSCMSKSAKDLGVPEHPARIYLAGDLQLAYLRRKGRVVARCIAWPEKKLYNNIYGDSALMDPILRKAGFKKGEPVGARLRKVEKKSGDVDFSYVAPHVDGVNQLEDKGGFLVLVRQPGDNTIGIGSGSGKTELVCLCPLCTAVRAKVKMAKFNIRGMEKMACKKCAERDGVVCPITGAWCLKSEMIDAKIRGKATRVSTACIANGQVFLCAGGSDWHYIDDRVTLKDGRTWSAGYAKTHGIICDCGMMRDRKTACTCKPVEWPLKVTATLEERRT